MQSSFAGPSGTRSTAVRDFINHDHISSPSPATSMPDGGKLDRQAYQAVNGRAPISPPEIPLGPLCHHYALAYVRESDFYLQAVLREERDGTGKGKGKVTGPAQEYMRLQYLALALLRIAAAQPGMMIKEQAHIAIDLGRVALRLMRAGERGTGAGSDRVDSVLVQEVSKTVSKALASVQKSDSLAALRRDLNILQAEITIAQGDEKRAVKMLKACRDVQADQKDSAYRYTIHLLLAQTYTTTSLSSVRLAMEELEGLMDIAEERGDGRVVQLAALARLRLAFSGNLWSEVEACLETCSTAMGYKEPANLPPALQSLGRSTSRGTSTEALPAPFVTTAAQDSGEALEGVKVESKTSTLDSWEVSIHIHFLCLQAAWESRIGETKRSKVYLDSLFQYGDRLYDQPCSSGVHEIRLQKTDDQCARKLLTVQLTPSSVLETIIYFAAGVSRRDTVGSNANNKRLRCSILGLERLASSSGTWDISFNGTMDLSRVYTISRNLQNLKAGFLFEQATTSLLRNAHEDTSKTISELMRHLRANELFPAYGLRLLLLEGQLAHSLNLTSRARQCYRACYSSANQNSDLEMVARLNDMLLLYGTKRGNISVGLESALTALIEQCSTSSDMGIRLASMALGALTSDGVQATKKRLSRVLTYCNVAELQVFRMVFFAISAPLYSHTQPLQSIKLLESALTISQHHGGSDRQSGVGLASLGMFVARELAILYAQTGRSNERIKMMQTTVQAHRRRFDELAQAGPKLAGMSKVVERVAKKLKTSHDAI